IVAAMKNPHLKGLVEAVLDDEEIARRYRLAPAAKQIHHAFLGGLIEHVLSLCGMAKMAAAHYANIDSDLLITGVVLHDVGKIYELNYERGFSYSNEGQLIGHISIGMRIVGDKLRGQPDFPPLVRSLVEHMILSHHGRLEFGSPKVPQFPEALLLHYLDDLDSKMEAMRAQIENDRQVEGCFTTYNAALERSALKKNRYLNPTPATTSTAEAKPTAPAPPARCGRQLPHGRENVAGAGAQGKLMSRTPRDVPPPLELACLKALWSLQEGKVRAVQEVVARSRPLAYTTIMTVLDRLVRKGKLNRRKVGRAFVYAPEASRDSMRHAALRELLDGYFDGSEAELLEFLRPVAAATSTPPAPSAPPAQEDRQIDTVLL